MSAHVLLIFKRVGKSDKMRGLLSSILASSLYRRTNVRLYLSHGIKIQPDIQSNYAVSHFSYAPLFQGPHFLTKMLESNILYDHLFIDILSV